jgi:hypothetical protein
VNFLHEKREMEEETRLGGFAIFIFSTRTLLSRGRINVFCFDPNPGYQQNLFLISYFYLMATPQ